MGTDEAVRRLHGLLPLRQRQRQLDSELQGVHRAILRSLAATGRPLRSTEIAGLLADGEATSALAHLSGQDLIVVDSDSGESIGAYPMTTETTPHRLSVNGNELHAMCAVDALAVSPMFGVETRIESQCDVTQCPVRLQQRGMEILRAEPSADLRVGIHWQDPSDCAAHSLCREMVFLRDPLASKEWQGDEADVRQTFTLTEAVEIAAAFFVPLLQG